MGLRPTSTTTTTTRTHTFSTRFSPGFAALLLPSAAGDGGGWGLQKPSVGLPYGDLPGTRSGACKKGHCLCGWRC